MGRTLLSLSVVLALSACSPQNSETTSTATTPAAKQEQAEQSLASGVIEENMDTSVDPGDDFFRYVNGKWVDSLDIPADKSSYGSFTILPTTSESIIDFGSEWRYYDQSESPGADGLMSASGATSAR